MEAYYAFSDEAGQYEITCGKRFLKSHPYYVRATLLVKIEEYRDYQYTIKNLNDSIGLPASSEIKWSDLWSKKHNQPRTSFIKHTGEKVLLDYYEQVLSEASKMESMKIIISVTENNKDNGIRKEKMMAFHLQEALQRVENELKGSGFATFIIDELPEDYSNSVRDICHSLINEGDIIKYKSLYSGVLFERSNMSVGIQLADYIAGISNSIFKSMNSPNNYTYAKRLFSVYILPRLRKSDSGELMGYGIREVKKNDALRNQIKRHIEKIKFEESSDFDNWLVSLS